MKEELQRDDALAGLLRACGRRPQPSPEVRLRAFDAVHETWRAVVRRRRRRRGAVLLLAAAAFAMIAIVLVRQGVPPPDSDVPVATVDRVLGTAQFRHSDGSWHPLTATTGLPPDTTLRTAPGSGLGLLLPGGASLRLGEATEASLVAADVIVLARGTAYVDAETGTQELEIRTAAGVVRDLGTQFELLYDEDRLRLSVREGVVILRDGDREVQAGAGERLTLDASGRLLREPIRAYDSDWDWLQELAPWPDLDNLPLTQFLDWVERETGRAVRFAQPEAEARARGTYLHGSPGRFAPMEALAVMLATTDFRYVVSEDAILIEETGR